VLSSRHNNAANTKVTNLAYLRLLIYITRDFQKTNKATDACESKRIKLTVVRQVLRKEWVKFVQNLFLILIHLSHKWTDQKT